LVHSEFSFGAPIIILWIVYFIIRVIRSNHDRLEVDSALADLADREPEPQREKPPQVNESRPPPPLPKLPFKLRWRHRLLHWRQRRDLFFYEWLHHYDVETSSIEIVLYVARRPYRLDLQVAGSSQLPIENVWFESEGDRVAMPFGVDLSAKSKSLHHIIRLVPDITTEKVTIQLAGSQNSLQYELEVSTVADPHPDFDLLRSAYELAEQGHYDRSLNRFRNYAEYSRHNPHVYHTMSRILQEQGDLDGAEACAIYAATLGPVEPGVNAYRQIRKGHDLETPLADIRALQQEAAAWKLPGHYGAIVLRKHQQVALGLGRGHLRRSREIYEIRRWAAARMMRRLAFGYEASRELLVYSTLRIVHPDDEIETVPYDHLTVGDAESENLFITTESKQTASWILPDLEVGDVIEWSNELICMDRQYDTEPHPFIVTSLAADYVPTHQGQVEFVLPDDYEVAFRILNAVPTMAEDLDEREGIRCLQLSDYLPAKHTGFPFESYYLNPLVVCSRLGRQWDFVARESLRTVVGDDISTDTFPAELAQELFTDDPTASLAEMFYWLRDRFKYGAFHAGTALIGQKDRACKLVAAGIGDCKDKTYLLALACRELGIPHQFLAISNERGIAVQELPADQFDHVFLRARPADAWLYLDAASNWTTFGNPPVWCQGMDALVLDGEGEFVTIPVDPPERNLLTVTECLRSANDGWLEDEIDLNLAGFSARDFDERWKTLSLTLDREQRAAQEACRILLPSVLLSDWERTADTSHSDSFHVKARGRRGPLIPLGDKLIASLSWRTPTLPLDQWRQFELDRLFVFMAPMTIQIELTIAGELHPRLTDVSRVELLDSEVCLVEEELQRSAAATTLRRTVTIRRKYVQDGAAARLPEAFEKMEAALHVVLAFDGVSPDRSLAPL